MCLGSNLSVDQIFVKTSNQKKTSINEILGSIIDKELTFDKRVKHISKRKVAS